MRHAPGILTVRTMEVATSYGLSICKNAYFMEQAKDESKSCVKNLSFLLPPILSTHLLANIYLSTSGVLTYFPASLTFYNEQTLPDTVVHKKSQNSNLFRGRVKR